MLPSKKSKDQEERRFARARCYRIRMTLFPGIYTLKYPFRGHGPRALEEASRAVEVNHERLLFSLTEEDPYWILRVMGFPSECAGKEFMPRAWAGLKWVLLQQGVPFTSEPELTSGHLEK
jgi:hypothetical protein